MINKALKAWVDENPSDRSVSVDYGLSKLKNRAYASTFEHGKCYGVFIETTDNINGQILAERDREELKEYKRLQEEFDVAEVVK